MSAASRSPVDLIRNDYIPQLRSSAFLASLDEKDTPPEYVPVYPLSWILSDLHDKNAGRIPALLGHAIMGDAHEARTTRPASTSARRPTVAEAASKLADALENAIDRQRTPDPLDEEAWLAAVLQVGREIGCDPYLLVGQALLHYGAQAQHT